MARLRVVRNRDHTRPPANYPAFPPHFRPFRRIDLSDHPGHERKS